MASLRSALWLLSLVFVIHDGEEILTMTRWTIYKRLFAAGLLLTAHFVGRMLGGAR